MQPYNTPGVYVEEISTLAPSVVPVSTAIPAFIGYTEKRPSSSLKAVRISSLMDFERLFGGPFQEAFSAEAQLNNSTGRYTISSMPADPGQPTFRLYYSLRMFYANGGGPCYIVSVGEYETGDGITAPNSTELINGLNVLDQEDEPTLILFPDAPAVINETETETSFANFYTLYEQALSKCARLKDRFTLIDLHRGDQDVGLLNGVILEFRNAIGNNNLSYGAAYYPWLLTNLRYGCKESDIEISVTATGTGSPPPEVTEIRLIYDINDLENLPDVTDPAGGTLGNQEKKQYYQKRSLFHVDNNLYTQIKSHIENFRVKLPPTGAVAGIYARVDNERGVFKAPANESLNSVIRPLVHIDDLQQDGLNVHATGKSVNVIRSFTGKGVLIWGARTLDGNSNEWRYVSVRRFFLFVEESLKKAIENFVFEANNESIWIRLRSLIENFLTLQWKAGALVGAKPDQAFYVQIGLGQTMSAQDVLEGRLIIDVGLAVIRPAEFILLRFTHKLPEA
jgi:phage tail sheath protein FI